MIKYAFIMFLSILILPNVLLADIYKWTDKEGNVHISNNTNNIPKNAQIVNQKPSSQAYIPQISQKTKEQHEKEIAKIKKQSKEGLDAVFSVANEGLITIRNGLIGLFISLISIQIIIKLIRQKAK